MSDIAESIANPILCSPYQPPDRHFEIGPSGPSGRILDGRRPSESFIPIAPSRKGKKLDSGFTQEYLDLELTHERRERNTYINDLRRGIAHWRQGGYQRVTACPAWPSRWRPGPARPW